MKAFITVIGKDNYGIIAAVSAKCTEFKVNIIDITQSVLHEYFAMIMLVDIDEMSISFNDFIDYMNEVGKEKNLEIRTMHEDIFNSMHRI